MRPTRTQTTVKTDMDSKEGIEKVAPVNAQAVGLLDPSLLRLGADDAATADLPRERADSPAGSCAMPDETPRWESYCLYSTRSLVTRYSPYYLMFGRRPWLPIDLLFPMHRTQMLTRTIDEYVASLYDHLRKSLEIAQDCAIKEAQRQKRLYHRKVGAVELRPGDNILVRLDAFRGQRRKLKNQWGSDLHTVVTCVADGIPAYVVKNNRTGKKKFVHWA